MIGAAGKEFVSSGTCVRSRGPPGPLSLRLIPPGNSTTVREQARCLEQRACGASSGFTSRFFRRRAVREATPFRQRKAQASNHSPGQRCRGETVPCQSNSEPARPFRRGGNERTTAIAMQAASISRATPNGRGRTTRLAIKSSIAKTMANRIFAAGATSSAIANVAAGRLRPGASGDKLLSANIRLGT